VPGSFSRRRIDERARDERVDDVARVYDARPSHRAIANVCSISASRKLRALSRASTHTAKCTRDVRDRARKHVVHVVERVHDHRAVRAFSRASSTVRVTTRAILDAKRVLARAHARSLCVEMLDLAT
jgi:hypothetical protein